MSDNASEKIHRWMTQAEFDERLDAAFSAGVAQTIAMVTRELGLGESPNQKKIDVASLNLRRKRD